MSLLVTACNAIKLGYENLPRLVEWQADRFLSLDNEQEALVNRHAKSLQRWHRQNLLPVYAEFLQRVEEELRSSRICRAGCRVAPGGGERLGAAGRKGWRPPSRNWR